MKIVRRGAVDGEDDGEKNSVAAIGTIYKEKKKKGKGNGTNSQRRRESVLFP